MKVKEKKEKLTEKSPKPVKNNGTAIKKKKKENFEVRIPRIIVRNLSFKVGKYLSHHIQYEFVYNKVNEDQLKKAFEKSVSGINNISIVKKG